MLPLMDWAGPNDALGRYIAEKSQNTLDAYRASPDLVTEHANLEADTAGGGYQHRQLFELVQNSADALSPAVGASATVPSPSSAEAGRIEIRLTQDCLYCADDGTPIDEDGVTALMFSHMSPKRATSQIGTFGVGFKSLLGVSDAPEFLSRAGSFRFDRDRARKQIRKQLEQTARSAESYPVLRVAFPVDPAECLSDEVGVELARWASNIVRLPLKPDAYEDLHQQMREFPAEFLLFVKHVGRLRLTDDARRLDRGLELSKTGDVWHLSDSDTGSDWRVFERRARLSADALADRLRDATQDEVPVWWAAPLDRLDRPGTFWTYFPTETQSLVAGILNAPWKTNVDRQNLLTGPYNDELIRAAAKLIAQALPELAASADPARHLDALPRRQEAGDSHHAQLLRKRLFKKIQGRKILPDQDGKLRKPDKLSYGPELRDSSHEQAAKVRELWASHGAQPTGWLHHKALSRNRMAKIDALFAADPFSVYSKAPRTSVGEWLEALVEESRWNDPVPASKTAVQIAAMLKKTAMIKRQSHEPEDFGKILLTASGVWRLPDPELVFLPQESPTVGSTIKPGDCVHPALTADPEARQALKKLGFREQTLESRFKTLAKRLLQDGKMHRGKHFREFWIASRDIDTKTALSVIAEHTESQHDGIRVLTRSGKWAAPHSVLLPGAIVPGDGSRDNEATVDMDFHEPDKKLLKALGVVAAPQDERDLWDESAYHAYQDDCEVQYRSREDLPAEPRSGYLQFTDSDGTGPLTVLANLTEEGQALYADALLSREQCYEPLTMWHTGTTRWSYPEQNFESLALHMIRKHGRIRTTDGIVPFTDALGENPANPDALLCLLRHPNAGRIKEAFDLADPVPEFFGVHDPVPLIDMWPGLSDYLHGEISSLQLVRCERIRVGHEDRECLCDGADVYLASASDTDDPNTLTQVSQTLDLGLSGKEISDIVNGTTPSEVERRRADVRRQTTDAGRLLVAVGAGNLRAGLPFSLLDTLERDCPDGLSDTEIAEAAIATHHTDALRQFRHALDKLKPPHQWAGSARAVDFVQSLGFSEEWAGERGEKRPPVEIVDGPWELPDLHDYQSTVVSNLRRLLRGRNPRQDGRRGLISMPTGSGKTRVAVQAIVEAIRDDDLDGGVLWIADRDELCEQAVEAWRQVWASIGSRATRLRVSRMWRNQPQPLPVRELHVVVSTIQTAHSKISSPGYDFLKEFRLVVFDEAHRSIAPTSTRVFGELGLTFRTSHDEPFLLGLTATPYRGHNEDETRRLVNRYGDNRLDRGAFVSDDPQQVIEELQSTGVLARADHALIDGATLTLTDDELSQMQKFASGRSAPDAPLSSPWLPQSAEDRIAGDAGRTRRIIDAFNSLIEPDWPTLVFATSVEHAQTVSALLNRRGVTARAVSGCTDHTTRRRVVEQFRSGGIQALVNYAVFREGFDAPRTRAIIVARPVYSPNLYFQMVGRGLRGPANGGNDRCLILNVADNIENFGRDLAFSELDWLWAPQT